MNVAVVGAGIAGLTAAWRLQAHCRVTLFEAAPYIGGHTATIDVNENDRTIPVDTGFIVYNTLNYPRFCALLEELNVRGRDSDMSLSVRCDRSNLEYRGSDLNTLFAQRSNLLRPRIYRLLRDIMRFNAIASDPDACADDPDITIGDFLRKHRFSKLLADKYLIPIGASIWSCPAGTFREFPAAFAFEFFRQHRMLQLGGRPVWRTIVGGSRTYVNAMLERANFTAHTNAPVKSVRRTQNAVTLDFNDRPSASFDHVILACHADQALDMLDAPTPIERDLLPCFPYQPNDVVLHTDASLLPKRRRAWAAWNYHIPREPDADVRITYNMNILQGLDARETYCVTLNESDRIDPERVIRRFTYSHPAFHRLRAAAQQRHDELIDHDRISYCGAWWGFGFHEDGVRSGEAVASRLIRKREPIPVTT